MKRKLLCTLLCLLFVLCTFALQAFAAKLNSEDVDWGISMKAEQVTPTGAVILVTQSGGNHTGNLEYGSPYHLEVWQENAWERVPYIREDVAWTMVAYGLPENQVTRWKEDWTDLYGELATGRYRFVKEFMDYRENGNDKAVFYAEFVIGVSDTSDTEETPDWGITLYAENVTTVGMTLVTNQMGGSSTGELEYDTFYLLQVFQDGEWQWVPEVVQYACPLEADNVRLNGCSRKKLDWEQHYGVLTPGQYRLVREFYDFGASNESVYLYVPFNITGVHACGSKDGDMLCDECLSLLNHESRDSDCDECCDLCGLWIEYRVVGSADWMGFWDAANDLGIMTKVENGVYRKTFKDVPPGDYQLKITKDGEWEYSWGDNGNNYTFTVSEQCDVTVDFRLKNGVGVISVSGPPVGWAEEEVQEPNPKDADLTVRVPAVLLLVCTAAVPLLLSKRKDMQ